MKDKITLSQASLLFLVMIYSASMRVIPQVAIKSAKQAAWLTPIVTLPLFLIVIMITKRFITKYPNQSFANIICDIMGNFIGKLIIVFYILWLLILLALYTRYFGERLVSSIYPNTNMNIFIILLLVIIGIMLRSGIVIIARMNKIIFPLIVAQFILFIILLIPNTDIKALTPISYLDIVPVFKSTMGTIGIWVYLFFLFMTSDKIIITNKLNKYFVFTLVFTILSNTILLVVLLGTFGAETALQIPLPALLAVKNAFREGNFSGLDSLFISMWILGDFIAITLFSYIIIQLFKSLYELKNSMPLLSILLVLNYFLSLYLTNEIFELQTFSAKLAIPINVIMGLGLPFLIFTIGKIRKKL